MISLAGPADLRTALALATLGRRVVRVSGIRTDQERVGLKDFEISFLRLLDAITDGSAVSIDPTGTEVTYSPGIITGGSVTFDCPPSRGLGYFFEPLLLLLPFAKKPSSVTLRGVTNAAEDVSVDTLREVSVPLLRWWGVDRAAATLDILRRGFAPAGGGEAVLAMRPVRGLAAVDFVKNRPVYRVRGTAVSARMAPSVAARWVDGARAVLNDFTPDVFIGIGRPRGPAMGPAPGYGGVLVAEAKRGGVFAAEAWANHLRGFEPADATAGADPNALGAAAARRLLALVWHGGCVDAMHQPLALCLMALTPEDVSRLRIGPLTPRAVATLRLIDRFFSVRFTFKEAEPVETAAGECVGLPGLIVSCRGAGFRNVSLRTK